MEFLLSAGNFFGAVGFLFFILYHFIGHKYENLDRMTPKVEIKTGEIFDGKEVKKMVRTGKVQKWKAYQDFCFWTMVYSIGICLLIGIVGYNLGYVDF